MLLAMFEKYLIYTTVRCLASRQKGGFRKAPKLPNIPIKGPRDFDYLRGLRRKPKNPKEKWNENLHERRRAIYKPKKKCEPPSENDETPE